MTLMSVSIVQTYILQLKRSSRDIFTETIFRFNCTNLHPSTETRWSSSGGSRKHGFNCTNLHPLTETRELPPKSSETSCFNCTNLHPLTETRELPPKSSETSCFNCTNLHPSTETEVSHSKALSEALSSRGVVFVSTVKNYILQLKL